ncbi:MAG: peptide deformylase [Bacilli bacterium]|nr:peptide deformylase [Bacilli bacterium]
MAVLDIIKLGNPLLREISQEIDLSVDYNYIKQLVLDMKDTVVATNGVGIAAPQVGVLKRVILVKDPETDNFFEMINPEITWTSFDKQYEYEGCLSVLDEQGKPIHKRVVRYDRLNVKWEDLNGTKYEKRISNRLLSRIIQHEVDHLNGKLFIDYLDEV